MDGHGVQTWPDGSKYTGMHKYGMHHGDGLMQWADKNSYNG